LHRNLARALRARGNLNDAAAHYRVSLLLDPSQAPVYFEFALVLAEMQQFGAAAQACEQACRLDPRHAEAHALLASISMALRQPRSALNHYRQALAVRPDNVRWQVQLALALATATDAALRDSAEALRIADKLSSEQSLDRNLLRDLSMLYATCGRTAQAAELERRAAQPPSPDE
jgi:tetratricopeptide (TPR) repeat protein